MGAVGCNSAKQRSKYIDIDIYFRAHLKSFDSVRFDFVLAFGLAGDCLSSECAQLDKELRT